MSLEQKQKYILVAISMQFFFTWFIQTATAQTLVMLSVQAGLFTILSPGTISLGTIPSQSTPGIVSGKIQGIKVSDLRGIGSGWSVILNATNLGLTGESAIRRKIQGGINSTANITDFLLTGVYDGLNGKGEFRVRIDAVDGVPVRPSLVTIVKPDGSSFQTIPSQNQVGFNGLVINFAVSQANYAPQDEFGIFVDYLPYGQLTIATEELRGLGTPSASLQNISVTPAGQLSGEGSKINVIADPNGGLGEYSFDDNVTLVLQPNQMPGNYRATFTYTLQNPPFPAVLSSTTVTLTVTEGVRVPFVSGVGGGGIPSYAPSQPSLVPPVIVDKLKLEKKPKKDKLKLKKKLKKDKLKLKKKLKKDKLKKLKKKNQKRIKNNILKLNKIKSTNNFSKRDKIKIKLLEAKLKNMAKKKVFLKKDIQKIESFEKAIESLNETLVRGTSPESSTRSLSLFFRNIEEDFQDISAYSDRKAQKATTGFLTICILLLGIIIKNKK